MFSWRCKLNPALFIGEIMQKECPRARHAGWETRRFLVNKDIAVQHLARMVVAGVDDKISLHPYYKRYSKEYGREKFKVIWNRSMTNRGGCDTVQTDMILGGLGMFGGLAENGKEFIFYEWNDGQPRFRVHMTPQDAQDIVSGKKKYYTAILCNKQHFAGRKRAFKKMLKRKEAQESTRR